MAEDSPFRPRAFIAGKNAVTLARDILALDQEHFSAAFRKSPMKRAKVAGLRRTAAAVLRNTHKYELMRLLDYGKSPHCPLWEGRRERRTSLRPANIEHARSAPRRV